MDDLVRVTRDEFFAFVGPRNVHPRAERDHSVWEMPGRQIAGKSTPGYLGTGEKAFFLVRPNPFAT